MQVNDERYFSKVKILLRFSILFLIVLYQYLCHCQLDTPHKGVVVIPIVQPETKLIHILLHIFNENVMECTQPHFGQTYPSLYFTDTMKFIADVSSGKRLVNSNYVIFVYIVCSHYKDIIFS